MDTTRPENNYACVFCARQDQPDPLFETHSLYVTPDKFPKLPGHSLIVTREHVRCYAMTSPALLHELDEAAKRTRLFLEETYKLPVMIFENGIADQTVFHAHLHLVPVNMAEFPPEIIEHADVTPVENWQQVQAYFANHGHYHYIQLGSTRYVISGFSPVLQTLRLFLAGLTGLTVAGHHLVKTTTPEDVETVNINWRIWTSDQNQQ